MIWPHPTYCSHKQRATEDLQPLENNWGETWMSCQHMWPEGGTKLWSLGNEDASASRRPFCCSWVILCKVFPPALTSVWGWRPGYICLNFCPHGPSAGTVPMSAEARASGLFFPRCTGQKGFGVFSLGTAVCPAVQHSLSPFSSTTLFSTPFCSLNLGPGWQPSSKLLTVCLSISPPFPHFFLILPLELVQRLAPFLRSGTMQQLAVS